MKGIAHSRTQRERSEIPLRRPAADHRLTRHFSPTIRLRPDGRGGLTVAHDHLHAPLQLTSLDHPFAVRARAHAGAHARVHQPRHRRLVRPLRHGHHRHAPRHALQRRVPPAVRHEAPHRRVRQHAHLVAPVNHHPLRAVAVGRAAAVRARTTGAGLSGHPQVRTAGRLQAFPHLLLLPPAYREDAPERHVHHGPRRPRLQPLHVRLRVVAV